MISIVGRLGDQRTVLSEVQIFDFETGKLKWIREEELLKIMADIGIKNVYGMDLVERQMIPIYEIRNNRKVISEKWRGKELAIAVIEHKKTNTTRILIKMSKETKYINYGQSLKDIKNVINLGISDVYNSGLVNEWSVTYPYNIVPIIKI